MNKILYLLTYLILLSILYFGTGELNGLALITPLIITSLLYFLYEIIYPIIKEKRKKKLIEFFKTKYAHSYVLKSNGDILFDFQNEKIMVEYHCDNINGTYLHNSISINIDISEIEQRLIDLSKIHFHTKKKYDKIWVVKLYKPFFKKRSIKYIIQESEKEIIKAINEYRDYIDKKRLVTPVIVAQASSKKSVTS
ncbi:MAG TPA: hypothetical protein VF985_07840 [Mariniflexile sp.]